MSEQTTEAAVLAAIEEVLRRELQLTTSVRPESRLAEELQLDSVSLLTLVVELENRFRVALHEEDAGEVRSVLDLARLVVRRAEEQVGEPP